MSFGMEGLSQFGHHLLCKLPNIPKFVSFIRHGHANAISESALVPGPTRLTCLQTCLHILKGFSKPIQVS
jgi:hypothetical protein